MAIINNDTVVQISLGRWHEGGATATFIALDGTLLRLLSLASEYNEIIVSEMPEKVFNVKIETGSETVLKQVNTSELISR